LQRGEKVESVEMRRSEGGIFAEHRIID